MPDSDPRVTIVAIFFNEERFLEEAVDSVLAQSFEDWELLLCDDGSTDRSTAIARAYAAAHPDRIRYLEHPRHENRGISTTRNLGIRAARGEFVAFLDGDDVWLPHKLEEQVAILDEHPEAGMVFGLALYWESWASSNPRKVDRVERSVACLGEIAPPPSLILESYPLGQAAAPCPSDFFVRRPVLERIGGFEDGFPGLYEDQPFLAKVYLTTPVYVADRTWIKYRQHEDSCLAQGHRDGRYDEVRRFYLEWLEKLLSRPEYSSERVRRALARAIRPYRYPAVYRWMEGLRQAAPRLRHWLSAWWRGLG